MNDKKLQQYVLKLQSQIGEIFQPECENYIDPEDLEKDDNATTFIHALSNCMPFLIYQKLTGEECDLLQFNHNCNRIIVNYSLQKEEP
jgi:hypothetical protein